MIYNFNMYTNIQTLFSIFCESQKKKKKKKKKLRYFEKN